MMRLTQIVSREAILAPIRAPDRDGAISELLDALIAANAADPALRDELIKRVLDRERKGSTGFGYGVALPHVKHRSVTTLRAAIGLAPRGIDFASLDRQPVYSVFMLLSPEDQPEDHLQAMEAIFKNISKETFRRMLRQCAGPDQVWELLGDADGQQLP